MSIDLLHAGWAVLTAMTLVYLFTLANGFHDSAYSIATVVRSGALKMWQAVALAGVGNTIGAFIGMSLGAKVAGTITSIVAIDPVPLPFIIGALLTAFGWNVATWWMKIPVSSSHCLLGSLIGAGIAAGTTDAVHWVPLITAIAALCAAPVIGFILTLLFTRLLIRVLGNPSEASGKHGWLRWLQIASSGWVAVGHGMNDTQKPMAIQTLLLASAFGYDYHKYGLPTWVIISGALAMGIGTTIGAPRMIEAVKKLIKEEVTFLSGFSTEWITGCLLQWGSLIGLPLSTTQTFTGSLAGSQCGVHGEKSMSWQAFKRLGTRGWFESFPVNWGTFGVMAATWFATLVITMLIAIFTYAILHSTLG